MAWRALERYESEKRADGVASFMRIADFLENLSHKNPETKHCIEITSYSRFSAYFCAQEL
jgi:hypothetical protein